MYQRLLFTVIVLMFATIASNNAHAQIETLVMPGKVIEGHADVETECSSCHLAFNRGRQPELCLVCHEDVASDIGDKIGFHGLFAKANEDSCASCHNDHLGRDADIVNLSEQDFDHDFTDYPLLGGHADVACADCHDDGQKHRDAPQECFTCHESDNVHDEFVGTNCNDCHSPTAWADIVFDHETTDYSLIGKHMDVACGDCHEDPTFQSTPTTCFGCHAEDDIHNGRSGEECENCHSPIAWSDTSFDHGRDTEFALSGLHRELICDDCHSSDPFADKLDVGCVSCHLEDDEHDGLLGESCDTCHVTDGWAVVVFDHNIDTGHRLDGAHEELECTACHLEPAFEVQLLSGCNDCHEEDDSHEGTQGTTCQDCHNEDSWKDNVFFDHDLTRFPLLGEHAAAECAACHETHRFRDAALECSSCHVEDNPHKDRFSHSCGLCHNPVDWAEWQFDHDTQTNYPLDGAHTTVSCDVCHRQSLETQVKLGSRCSDCHRADDIHNGEFGFDCGRCHSAQSFEEVIRIR